MLPFSPFASSTTYNFHVPFGWVVLLEDLPTTHFDTGHPLRLRRGHVGTVVMTSDIDSLSKWSFRNASRPRFLGQIIVESSEFEVVAGRQQHQMCIRYILSAGERRQ